MQGHNSIEHKNGTHENINKPLFFVPCRVVVNGAQMKNRVCFQVDTAKLAY